MGANQQEPVKARRRAARRGQHAHQRRAAQPGRHEQRRRQRHDQPARRLTRDQRAVAERLTAGQIDLVTLSGWGVVGQFLAFVEELPFFALVDIEGAGYKRVMIPLVRLIRTQQVKVLLGIGSINRVPLRRFRDHALVLLIGHTTTQIRAGFRERGHLAAGPMPKKTLADAVERLSAEEREPVLNETVNRLVARGVFTSSRGHFALDASDVETTNRSTGAGMKTVTERRVTPKQEVVAVGRSIYGFKVRLVSEVRLRLVAAATVVPINAHESRHSLALVRQASANLGPGVPRVRVLDKGFLDGETLWTLTHDLGLDLVVPSQDGMHVTTDARLLARRARPSPTRRAAARPGRVPLAGCARRAR